MIWTVHAGGSEVLVLQVTDDFLMWLHSRARAAAVKALDPYCDARLDRDALPLWIDEMARIEVELRAEERARLLSVRRLPSDLTVREALLDVWVAQELGSGQNFQTLLEVRAALSLALESDGVVEMMGD